MGSAFPWDLPTFAAVEAACLAALKAPSVVDRTLVAAAAAVVAVAAVEWLGQTTSQSAVRGIAAVSAVERVAVASSWT